MKYKYLYWLTPIVLFFAQAYFTLVSRGQIRYEEYQYKEVYWFAHHLVWDPLGAGDLGFYGTMYVFNNIFGFSLFGFKIFRLALDAASLLCLSLLLKKLLGEKRAIIPLVTIGLSPTILFFNTMQVPYGIDLQYLPIILYCMLVRPKKKLLGYLATFASGFLTMLAWLSYATFVFYLPVLFLFVILGTTRGRTPESRFWMRSFHSLTRMTMVSLMGFLLPFVAHVLWIYNRDQLIDPATGIGLFRGSGSFQASTENFYQGLKDIVINLFVKADSYHYEVAEVDFSYVLPAIAILFCVVFSIKQAAKHKEIKPYVLLCLLLGVSNIIITCLTESSFNGFRRNTPLIAALYGFFLIAWYIVGKWKMENGKWKIWGTALLSILLVHHIIAYPLNIAGLKVPSPFMEYSWFETKTTPFASFMYYQQKLRAGDLHLNCQEKHVDEYMCNYTDLYAALVSDCFWNNTLCHTIYGYLPQYKQYKKLTIGVLSAYDHEKELPRN